MNRKLFLYLIMAATVVGCGESGSSLDDYRSQLSSHAINPRFSPDDSQIVYEDVFDGRSGVLIADSELGNESRVSFGLWDFNPVWSPDGNWIAFDRDSGIGEIGDVWMTPARGGEEVSIARSAAQERIEGWFPDGSAVLYARNAQTWAGPIDGSENYRILDIEDFYFAKPSPDGSQVAYSRSDGSLRMIWLFDRESGEHHRLTEEGYEGLGSGNDSPWSPDGTLFGFTTASTGTGDIWIADATTRSVRQLTRHLGNDYGWRWSPDGKWIAFLSNRGGQIDVWAIRADGSGAPIRITDDSRPEFGLNWSPDGSRLIFNEQTADVPVGIVGVNGENSRIFMTARTSDFDFRPSPDASKVLFTSTRSGNPDLWSVEVEGGEPQRLTRSPMPDQTGLWSPDGQTIVFDSRRNGNLDIYTMLPDGENVVQLTDWPGSENQASWSPDGSVIAFVSDHEAAQGDIWTIPATGGEPTRITTLDAPLANLSWSPDGQDLVFHKLPTASDTTEALYRVSAQGGPVLNLFEGDFNNPQWSPDGQRLLFSIIRDGFQRLHIMPADGGTPRRVTSDEREWDFGGLWLSDGNGIIFNRLPLASGRGETFLAVVSADDPTVRPLVQDSTLFFNGPRLSGNGTSIVYWANELDTPVGEVRIEELLADHESAGN